jgi:copper chaperone CopZ
MKTEKIIIENLKCHGCANTIRKGLSRIEEVGNVDIDIEGSSVKIEYEGENNMRVVFIEKLRKLGYPQDRTGKLNQQIKSYISCAIGRVNK